MAIEAPRILGERGVAPSADIGDDRGDIARDIGVGLATGVDERIEGGGEAGIAIVEAEGGGHSNEPQSSP